jgi:GT2 family glycosyltransferase
MNGTISIAVIIPTIYRPDGLRRVLSSLMTSDVTPIVIMERDDKEAVEICLDYLVRFRSVDKPLQGPAYAWNTGLKHFQFYDAYFLGSDDIVFEEGWLSVTLGVLKSQLNGSGLVGVNDGTGKFERTGWATQYLMTKDFIIEENGGVLACPHYLCDFTDVEACLRAQRVNKFAYASEAKVTHHWREVDDEAYKRADGKRKAMKVLFEKRKEMGFPDDYERII